MQNKHQRIKFTAVLISASLTTAVNKTIMARIILFQTVIRKRPLLSQEAMRSMKEASVVTSCCKIRKRGQFRHSQKSAQ